MSTHNDDLIQELKSARLRKRKKLEELIDARAIYVAAKAAVAELDEIIDEVLQEIETGKSGRPLMDAVNGHAKRAPDLPESAQDGSPDRPAVEEARPDGSGFGPMDERQALRAALARLPYGLGTFERPMDDRQIQQVLFDWSTERQAPPDGRPGCAWATVGGPNPGIWIGHQARPGQWPGTGATYGQALIDMVRKEMKIQRPSVKREQAPALIPQADGSAALPTPKARKPKPAAVPT